MSRATVRAVRRELRALDPERDANEIARLSLVTLHGRPALVYTLFTVAFLKQVAVPTMARTLYRRGTGDIVRQTIKRNDDTIVFFGQLLDHGPDSPTGRAWIERLNAIHAHFPLRNDDSLYTLATLALDPEAITRDLGADVFDATEREAQWRFWRAVAERQLIERIPEHRHELQAWANDYQRREYAPTEDGQAIAAALVQAFGERCLPRPLRRWDGQVVAALCPPALRQVHDLPRPSRAVSLAVRLAMRVYGATHRWQLVDRDRSLVRIFGDDRYGSRPPEEVGYQRATMSR